MHGSPRNAIAPRHGWAAGLVLLALLPALSAEKPGSDPRLQDRSRWAAEITRLRTAGKLEEAQAVAEKKLRLEREVFGAGHPELVDTLNALGLIQELRNDFAAARRSRQEVLDIQVRRFGKEHWQVTSARLALAYVEDEARLTPEQLQRHVRARELDKQVHTAYGQGKYAAARAPAEELLRIRREVLGRDHPRTADALALLGVMEMLSADYPAAGAHLEEARTIRAKQYGTRHPEYANAVSLLGSFYYFRGDLVKARPLIETTCDLSRELFGEKSAAYADALNNLAALQRDLGDVPASLALCRQVRDLRKQLFGVNSVAYANSVHNLATACSESGDLSQALRLFEQCLALRRKLLPPGHPHTADTINNLAAAYLELGDFAKAIELFEEARQMRRKVLTEQHPAYADSLRNLAGAYQKKGDFTRALQLLEEARTIYSKFGGRDDPGVVNALASLASERGDLAPARALYQQAADLRRQQLGPTHPLYASTLEGLAAVYREVGDPGRALDAAQRALAIRKQTGGENQPAYARCLNTLATAYWSAKDYTHARERFEQARAACKALHLDGTSDYALVLNNLGALYQTQLHDCDRAAALYEESLAIRRRTLGERHPAVIQSLTNLASLANYRGDYNKALRLSKQVLERCRESLSPDHPLLADSWMDLGMDRYALGEEGPAAKDFEEALRCREAFIERTLSVLSERQRQEFVADQRLSVNLYLSVAQKVGLSADATYARVLAWKGILAGRHGEERRLEDRPELKALREPLAEARAGLAQLALHLAVSEEGRADWLQRFDVLERRKEDLESRLAQADAVLRGQIKLRTATAADVARTLPRDAALVDFLVYGHYTPPPEKHGLYPVEERLLAFVLARDRGPVCVQLGPVDPVTRAFAAWRRAVVAGRDPAGAADRLVRLVWRPLLPHLGDHRTVLIAPDGPLCGLPFAALPGEAPDSYLVEDWTFGSLVSGRQLLELAVSDRGPRGEGLLAVGGLVYGPTATAREPALHHTWGELPGTQVEVEDLAKAYRQAFEAGPRPVVSGGPTLEADGLKRLLAPAPTGPRWRYVHLATHGFFEPDPTETEPAPGTPLSFEAERTLRVHGRNPLLSSGLVLSRANAGARQGILTAEEVAALDLRGVELVVLSACDTGRGQLVPHEGVLGLQRAFQAAGARSLLTSLWSVNDAATSVLMKEFYANLWQQKRSRWEALRQAQLAVLRHPERVQERQAELAAELRRKGVTRELLAARGIEEEASPLPAATASVTRAHRSPPRLWAAFVLSGDGR